MVPALLPNLVIVKKIARGGRALTVADLCEIAGIECRVTGPPAGRVVHLREAPRIEVSREPGPLGEVSIGLPGGSPRSRAVLALGVMAYSVFDYAARESARGVPETRPSAPRGRPRLPKPASGAERQRRWRSKHRIDTQVQ